MSHFASGVQADAQPLELEEVELGTLGGADSRPYDLNDLGQVVGSSQTADGVEQAFLWDRGTMTALLPAGPSSKAIKVNNRGQVLIDAGGAGSPGDGPAPSVWLWENGAVRHLGPGRALALSENGVVAGVRATYDEDGLWTNHIVVWDEYGEHSFHDFGERAVTVLAASEADDLLVWASDRAQTRKRIFLVSPGPSMPQEWTRREVLGPDGLPPGQFIVTMNRLGVVAATSAGGEPFTWRDGHSNFVPRAPPFSPVLLNAAGDIILWSVAGRRMVQISNRDFICIERNRKDWFVRPAAISEGGLLVGDLCDYCAVPGLATAWHRGQIVWQHDDYSAAIDVNENGEIAGVLADGHGPLRAVLWRPR